MAEKKTSDICQGGRSFGCLRKEHAKGKVPDIYCMTCKTRMGCSVCCQIPRELLCLECHDWAHRYALAAHGHIVKGTQRLDTSIVNPVTRMFGEQE